VVGFSAHLSREPATASFNAVKNVWDGMYSRRETLKYTFVYLKMGDIIAITTIDTAPGTIVEPHP
jgi:hypothetical protein